MLVVAMLLSMLALPVSASAPSSINVNVDIEYAESAPSVNGKIASGEYGQKIHRYSSVKSQFNTDHDDYKDWDVDFYMTWDESYLYMAWDVMTDVVGFMPEQDFSYDGAWGDDDYGFMWMYSAVQFRIVRGVPKYGQTNYQTSTYSGDYLDVGFASTSNNNDIISVWCTPLGIDYAGINAKNWSFAVNRNNSTGKTTYEVAVPWSAIGVVPADGNIIGVTYAVGAQEDYNNKRGMLDWQGGVLNPPCADKAAVVTLNKAKAELPEGVYPSDASGKMQFPIYQHNEGLVAESTLLVTNISSAENYNLNWAYVMVLSHISGNSYSLVHAYQNTGNEEVDYDLEDGMIILALHTHEDGGGGEQAMQNAKSLSVGTTMKLFGFQNGKQIYSNPMMYVVSTPSSEIPDDPENSEKPDDPEVPIVPDEPETSDEPDEGDDNSSADESFGESSSDEESEMVGNVSDDISDASSDRNDEKDSVRGDDEEEDLDAAMKKIIIIGVIVMIVLAVLFFIFALIILARKKKKEETETVEVKIEIEEKDTDEE